MSGDGGRGSTSGQLRSTVTVNEWAQQYSIHIVVL